MNNRLLAVGSATLVCLAALGCTPPVTSLYEAATIGNKGAARKFLRKGQDINASPAGTSWTPLLAAADNGHDEMVELLIKNGATVDARDSNGDTPLCLAAAEGHEETAVALLKAGADPRVRNNKGQTPLDLAVGRPAIELILRKALGGDAG